MHQPLYKDLWTGQYKLPWTRLHALKDYYGMVRVLEEFPEVRQTFNLVPSMVVQIEEYAAGTASDPFLECAVKPVETLNDAQRHFLQRYFFQAQLDRIISRFPRYRELYDRRTGAFSDADLRDLQVLSQLAWFDEDLLAHDPEVLELVRKGRDFSLDDQAIMASQQVAALGRVLPVYREFAARGQIEISTTPFYHPILPLVCDSEIARVSHPGVSLPSPFRYPQDAREQLSRARSYIGEKFSVQPAGLWPSEGSVSDEALALAADCGFTWAATDNGVLANTLQRIAGADLTYQAYVWRNGGREMRMLFRDHYLSDLIGFNYSQWDPGHAADHFLGKIHENTEGRDALVPIILDGENAWEWYEANGRRFLRELYKRITDNSQWEAITVSDALNRFENHPLDHIFPGSWIDSNFDVWIGAEEDNLAGELLRAAREEYDKPQDVPEEKKRLAYEELLIAEGSDWCWWYGPEHVSENQPEFDELYREHLTNVYRALDVPAPAALSRPILRAHQGEFRVAPKNPIHAVLDGEVTSYYEWYGAGRYAPDPRSGAMHGAKPLIREMFYGCDESHLYVRLDPEENIDGAAFAIEFDHGTTAVRTVRGRVIEMCAPLVARRFRVMAERDGVVLATLPAQGWMDLDA